MPKNYEISFEQVHFRTSLLKYSDSEGKAEVYFEESVLPEYDWISSEPKFGLPADSLAKVLMNIADWAHEKNVNLKIWCQDELGI